MSVGKYQQTNHRACAVTRQGSVHEPAQRAAEQPRLHAAARWAFHLLATHNGVRDRASATQNERERSARFGCAPACCVVPDGALSARRSPPRRHAPCPDPHGDISPSSVRVRPLERSHGGGHESPGRGGR